MNTDQVALARLLHRDDHAPTVKIYRGCTRWDKITLTEARSLIQTGEYDWAGTRCRVKQIRLLNLRAVDPTRTVIHAAMWESCYRTTEAATLQPSIEWITTRRAQ